MHERQGLSVLQFLIRMSLELPPEPSDLMAGWSSNPLPGAVDPLALVHSTWALEAFIDVSPCTPPPPFPLTSTLLCICPWQIQCWRFV